MNRLLGLILVVLIILGGLWVVNNSRSIKTPSLNPKAQPGPSIQQTIEESKGEVVSVVAKNLEVPWALSFLPDGRLLVTERAGRVRLIEKDGTLQTQPVLTIADVKQTGESGLHGIAIHPDFSSKPFVYFYYTYSSSGNNSLNKVVRYKFENNSLSEPKVIVEGIPGAIFHDGGRIKFGPDNMLYITTGDAQNPSLSQDTNSLAGKILRVTDEGQPVSGNPFNNLVYSYGHRNPQGIAWDDSDQLWETEHGPSGGGLGSGNDEFNKIEIGKNYGWPEIQGDQSKLGLTPPVIHSGTDTWAPAGLVFFKNSFFFGGLRGKALYKVELRSYQVKFEGGPKLLTHFKGEFGRIREVVLGPDNMLYITTSNKDGRGDPQADDDRIIRVNPERL